MPHDAQLLSVKDVVAHVLANALNQLKSDLSVVSTCCHCAQGKTDRASQ